MGDSDGADGRKALVMEGDRTPWERQKGESRLAFEGFTIYLELGAGRSLQGAWEHYHQAPRQARKRCERGAKEVPPGRAPGYWQKWSVRWHWVARAEARDGHLTALRRKIEDDAAVATAIREAEENERQRGLRIQEARSLRAAGRAVYTRFLQLVQDGGLRTLTLQHIRHVQEGGPREGFARREDDRKAVTELLDLATRAIEVGQKLERLELGEVTDRTETRSSDGDLEAARRFITSRLDRLAAAAAEGGGSDPADGDGRPDSPEARPEDLDDEGAAAP
jgi:hypothetical protein